ncbi:MAG: PHB depolymerase family esterase [Loktanella sp.]|nr:PHB depolymerase family esterase [Loktanella sp.]
MMKFNAGAQRLATKDALAARLAAANDLVQRTLAQHRLLPGQSAQQQSLAQPILSKFDGLPHLMGDLITHQIATTTPVPDGAEFRRDSFACDAGSRPYRVYVPSTASEGVTGIVMMLHGCTQTPEDFAAGTNMNALAEDHRFVVIYPQQSREDNVQSCWNWFKRGDQRRGRGEPAILAALAQKLMVDFDVPRDHCFVAGLSAGAAMAIILGETYGDVFAAVGAHSGMPYGSAKDVPSAFAAMAGNGQTSPASPPSGSVVRTIVFHGKADTTVHPSNSDRIGMNMAAGQVIETTEQGTASGRSFSRSISSQIDGKIIFEHWSVDSLGHAWSGGQPGASYTDPKGPDASAAMVRFFYQSQNESR